MYMYYSTTCDMSSGVSCVSVTAVDIYRVRLIMVPGFECSDYINASYVDVSDCVVPRSPSLTLLSLSISLIPSLPHRATNVGTSISSHKLP